MKLKRLIVDHLLQYLFRRLEVVPRPVERLLALGLGLLVVQALEVRVLQALFHRVAFLRVEHQHFTQEVKRHGVRLGVEGAPTLFVALR